MKLLHKINYFFFSLFNTTKVTPADEEIDVIIPVTGKDMRVLPLCLEGIKTCVRHPVKNIYIVAPPQDEIISFCKTNGLTYVNEASVFGFSPKELDLQITSDDGIKEDRSGWLFQQLIKLSGAIGTCRNYLCIDADHVLLQPHTFIDRRGTPVFYMNYDKHQPYYAILRKLTGAVKPAKLSYVAHKMIMNKEQVALLHNRIREHCRQDWLKAIVANYDRTQISGFSEFETYGHFVTEKIKLPWKQRSASYRKLADYRSLVKQFGKRYRSITFPEFYNH
jgi:hypothetical protein